MSSATTSPRKPKPKVRALKGHRPVMRIDVEKAERLAREIRDQGMVMYRLYQDFLDTINRPFNQIAIHRRAEDNPVTTSHGL